MSNLAGVLDRQGKYNEAEEMHRWTLELRERVLGKERPDTLMSIYCLAHLLQNQKRQFGCSLSKGFIRIPEEAWLRSPHYSGMFKALPLCMPVLLGAAPPCSLSSLLLRVSSCPPPTRHRPVVQGTLAPRAVP
jgi:hypothetical protein